MDETNDLRRRVEHLERRSRGLVVVAALALGLAVLGLAAARPRVRATVIEAERFVVRDRAGAERAVLGLDHPESPSHSPVRLGLRNAAHGARALLYLSGAFAGLVTVSPGSQGVGRWRTELYANPRDGAGLRVQTTRRQTPIHLFTGPDGAGGLVLGGAGGAETFSAP